MSELLNQPQPREEIKLPYEGEALGAELLRRQSPTPEGLEETAEGFEGAYRKMPVLGQELAASYSDLAQAWRYNPGRIYLYMVGGRVKGTPLKEDSDIDLIFAMDNPKESFEVIRHDRHPGKPLDAMDERLILKQEMIRRADEICQKNGVINNFHILGYGTDFNPDAVNAERSVLIGISNPEKKAE